MKDYALNTFVGREIMIIEIPVHCVHLIFGKPTNKVLLVSGECDPEDTSDYYIEKAYLLN